MIKMRISSFAISIFAGVLILTGVVMFAGNNGSVAVTDTKIDSNSKTLTSHAPIYINGNADFSDADDDGVSNPGAAGTASDPYIIENWDISASSADGIEIRNTTVYFVVRKCVISDGFQPEHNVYNYGIYFYDVQNGKIENCEIHNSFRGVELEASSNNVITLSQTYNNDRGIELDASSNNTIASNQIYGNSGGVELSHSSNNNTMTSNQIYYNGGGIELCSSSNNHITNCWIHNNLYGGICIGYSSNNTCAANQIYNNSWGIEFDSSSDNTIASNRIYGNSGGIKLSHSSNNNIISSNQIYYNGGGIELRSSSDNDIINCQIYNNYGTGVYLTYSSNNSIINSEVYNNKCDGIRLWYSSNNEVHYSNIYNNTDYGIYNYNTEVTHSVNATYNWWGSADGPSGIGSGRGNAVSDNVLYNPWLTEPVKLLEEAKPSVTLWLYIIIPLIIIIVLA
ncbi:MAG: right-handed parallel beta-helix repeat-containing protein, partial [Candidatus Thermoplasmatota archaeon]